MEVSWCVLGASWRSRGPLGASWVPLGVSWGLLGAVWAPLGGLGSLGSPGGPLGAILEDIDQRGGSFNYRRPSRASNVAIWRPLGTLLGALGAVLGPSWASLGGLLGHLGAIVRPRKAIRSEKAIMRNTLISSGVGRIWASWVASWGAPRPLGAVLGRSWRHLEHLGSHLELSSGTLSHLGGHLGLSEALLE